MKSEGIQSVEGCSMCKEISKRLMRLHCGHGFCVKCLAFTYHKHSSSMPRLNLTRCMVCERTCQLPEPDLAAIMEFTDQVLVPMVREEHQRQGQSQFQLSNNDLSSGKQFKSHEMSTQKVTPAGKGFYSRCESPKAGFGQGFCQVHPDQQLTVVCFTCNNAILCISCVTTKKHNHHNVQTIGKAIQTIQQHVAESKLHGKQHLEDMEMIKRRLDGQRNNLQDKWDKTLTNLKMHFNNLLDQVNRKCDEVLVSYSSFFEQSMEEAVKECAKVDEAIRHTKRQLERLTEISHTVSNPVDLIKKSTQVMETLRELKMPELMQEIGQSDSERVIKQLTHITDKLQKLQPQCHRESLKTHGCDNWKSEEKLKDNYFKRVKTNVMSLNSSRERRQKKCAKTEQDQRRQKSKANLKTEANMKTQSSGKLLKVNKALPTYLLQHLEKQREDLPECLLDMQPLQSSFKSSSKALSKSHLPSAAEEHRRKKEHQAYIKDCLERRERKTFNATAKDPKVSEPIRKRKAQP